MAKKEIMIQKIKDSINRKKDFYRLPEIVYSSKNKIDNEIAEFLLACDDSVFIKMDFKNEDVDKRIKQYVNGTHKNHIKKLKQGLYELTSKNAKKSDQREKFIAKRLFELSYSSKEVISSIMEIKDYEIPVNSVYPQNKMNVDLIGWDNENAYLIELKNDISDESLLRAVLEIKTYIERIKYNKTAFERFNIVCGNRELVPTIFLFDNTVAFNDVKEMKKNKPKLYELCIRYGIRIFKVNGEKKINTIDDIKNIKFDISEFNYNLDLDIITLTLNDTSVTQNDTL